MQHSDKNNHSCTFCASRNSETFCETRDIFGNAYTIQHCLSCGCFYLSPFPTEEQLWQAYDTSYYGETEQKFSFTIVEKAVDYFRQQRARKIVKMLPRGARLLDIGCGNGDFLRYVSLCGNYELYGIERDETAARRARAKANIHLQTTALMDGDFEENSFDAITLFHVFEHLTAPAETLRVIQKILKPEGVLILSMPNIGSWQARIFRGKWLHLDPPRHLLFFEPKTFTALMDKRSFALRKTSYVSIEQNPFGLVQSLLNVASKRREVLFERLKGNRNYAPEYGGFRLLLQKCFFVLHFPLFVLTDMVAAMVGKSATVKFYFINKK